MASPDDGRHPLLRVAATTLGAVALGAGAVWAMVTGASAVVVAFPALGALYFVGLTLPAIYDRVPQYRYAGLLVVCAIGALGMLSVQRVTLAFGLALVAAANGAGAVQGHRRDGAEESEDSE